jgi:hypothetical protein
MLYKKLIGKKVKYYAGVRHNGNFQQMYKDDELTIKGIDAKRKMIVVQTKGGEYWHLTPQDVRYLNNGKLNIF